MKVSVLFLMVLMNFSFAGCRPESEETPALTASGIVIRAVSGEIASRSAAGNGAAEEPVVFSGEDILWFNETTGELRFKDNISNASVLTGLYVQAIKFYVDDEYLFPSMLCVSDFSSQTFNSLVFYYNVIENRYFLRDGYPDAVVLPNPQKAQELRDENMRKITPEWERFLEQLKKERRYKN
jgi:hypothetical protein